MSRLNLKVKVVDFVQFVWWAASRTRRQIIRKALRRSHFGSGQSLGGPGGIIEAPFSLTAYSAV